MPPHGPLSLVKGRSSIAGDQPGKCFLSRLVPGQRFVAKGKDK